MVSVMIVIMATTLATVVIMVDDSGIDYYQCTVY